MRPGYVTISWMFPLEIDIPLQPNLYFWHSKLKIKQIFVKSQEEGFWTQKIYIILHVEIMAFEMVFHFVIWFDWRKLTHIQSRQLWNIWWAIVGILPRPSNSLAKYANSRAETCSIIIRKATTLWGLNWWKKGCCKNVNDIAWIALMTFEIDIDYFEICCLVLFVPFKPTFDQQPFKLLVIFNMIVGRKCNTRSQIKNNHYPNPLALYWFHCVQGRIISFCSLQWFGKNY